MKNHWLCERKEQDAALHGTMLKTGEVLELERMGEDSWKARLQHDAVRGTVVITVDSPLFSWYGGKTASMTLEGQGGREITISDLHEDLVATAVITADYEYPRD